jgi:protein-S-isoprenylcysteine O-methyltransferase Ste14
MLPQRVLMTVAEAEAVRRSFARRQIGILILSALTLAGFIVAVAISQWTLLLEAAFGALVVMLAIGSVLVWRCPRCGESFGRNWLVTQCPHCFAELTKRKPSSGPSA